MVDYCLVDGFWDNEDFDVILGYVSVVYEGFDDICFGFEFDVYNLDFGEVGCLSMMEFE